MDRPLAATQRRIKRVQPGRTQRLFFALWPQPTVRAALSAWRDQAQALAGGGRAMQSRNLHMTLVFLGDTRGDRVPAIQRAAASVKFEPCMIKLDRRAFWKHNRIVWAGGDTPAKLAVAVTQLREALAAADVGFDAKPFVPHLTLLRDARAFDDACVPEAIDWTLSDFILMASRYDATGLLYRVAAGPFGVDAR